MLRVVGRLDNLRPAPGPQGELKKIPRPNNFYSYMTEDETSFFAFPMCMCCTVCLMGDTSLTDLRVQLSRFILMGLSRCRLIVLALFESWLTVLSGCWSPMAESHSIYNLEYINTEMHVGGLGVWDDHHSSTVAVHRNSLEICIRRAMNNVE